jgi:hypothetical protein
MHMHGARHLTCVRHLADVKEKEAHEHRLAQEFQAHRHDLQVCLVPQYRAAHRTACVPRLQGICCNGTSSAVTHHLVVQMAEAQLQSADRDAALLATQLVTERQGVQEDEAKAARLE